MLKQCATSISKLLNQHLKIVKLASQKYRINLKNVEQIFFPPSSSPVPAAGGGVGCGWRAGPTAARVACGGRWGRTAARDDWRGERCAVRGASGGAPVPAARGEREEGGGREREEVRV